MKDERPQPPRDACGRFIPIEGPSPPHLNAGVPRPRSAGQPHAMKPGDQLRRWAVGCPLWRYRRRKRMTRLAAAELFGVTSETIKLWERGARIPGQEHMTQMVELLGPETIFRWVKWMDKRPGWGE